MFFSHLSSAEKCGAGEYVEDDTDWPKKKQYTPKRNDPSCKKCPIGFYRPDSNLETKCLKCPRWHNTTKEGSLKCKCKYNCITKTTLCNE